MLDRSTILCARAPAEMPDFCVLLGPDYAGKSTLLKALSARASAHVVSYDDSSGSDQPSFAKSFRDAFTALSSTTANGEMSSEFILSLFHAYAIFVRDQIANAKASKPIIVDSYYYKILAKCVLAGIANDRIVELWRALPQPSRVFYLDVDPEVAWRRCDRGMLLNRFEYYGSRPTQPGFALFQQDLRAAMLKEVAASKIEFIDQNCSLEQLICSVDETVGFGRAHSAYHYDLASAPVSLRAAYRGATLTPAFMD